MAVDSCTRKGAKKTRPRVFSYVRFSTPEQSLGDSERRQLEAARSWAKRMGLRLDESLDLTDRGFSGYHGTHRTKGALGKFLAAVEAGDVPAGSTLLVENVDRLSREGAVQTLRGIVFKLWDRGITLQTLSPEEEYGPGCDNDPKFLALFLFMQRAQDESKRKSERIRAARDSARQRARENRRIVTAQCPAWLTVKDGEFVPVSKACEAIRLVFELKLRGLGKELIARKLNVKSPWTPPARKRNGQHGTPGWRGSYIAKILSNRAVLGEYQPFVTRDGHRRPEGEVIPDYFPAIVDPKTFHAVQARSKANRAKGGRTGKARNLFAHLAKCTYCGGSMAFIDKGKPPKGRQYLACDNARRGLGCKCTLIRYDEVEKAILDNCRRLKPEQVLPDPDEQAKLCQALRLEITGLERQATDIDEQVTNLIDQIARTKQAATRDLYEARITALNDQRSDVEKRRGEAEGELAKAEQAARSFTKWKRGLAELREALTKEDPELRLRLRAHLRELIDRIDIFATGFRERYDLDEEARLLDPLPKHERRKAKAAYMQSVDGWAEEIEAAIGDSNPGWKPDGEFYDFVEHVTQRRMSREGRFFRVRFKSGSTVDVVPDGSLASGMALTKDGGWRFVTPALDKLDRDHQIAPGRAKRPR